MSGGGSGVVRHIQRGSVTASRGTSTYSVSLGGFTDLSKMIAIIDGGNLFIGTSNNGGSFGGFYDPSWSMTLNVLTINLVYYTWIDINDRSAAYASNCRYQVIEFY